jgi:hypothetical protein
MDDPTPESLALIAGRGAYPFVLAESARRQGVHHISVIAFRHETDARIAQVADEVRWVRLGQIARFLEAIDETGIKDLVMVGQIRPKHLFRVRLDRLGLEMLRALPEKNAHTIFGAVADSIRELGVNVLPAYAFMGEHMPPPGLLSRRAPLPAEETDIEIGRRLAQATSGLDIGQTVVIKNGAILAVEAFEGTDQTIRRAARLGGHGIVVVKVAKRNHDMRFDIPVIGMRTMKLLRKVKAAVLAVEAGRAIVLERDRVIEAANAMGLCLTAFEITGENGMQNE